MLTSRTMLAAAVATAAALALVPAGPAAHAAPPTERTITDPVDAQASYDIRKVRLLAAPAPGKRARIVVGHDRRVRVGDGIDVWVDLDRDRKPDVYLTGMAFSEYAVYRARSFDGHGRDISDRGCFDLTMRARRSVVRFAPDCLGASRAFAVTVRSFRHGEPAGRADWSPRQERLSARVLSSVPAAP